MVCGTEQVRWVLCICLPRAGICSWLPPIPNHTIYLPITPKHASASGQASFNSSVTFNAAGWQHQWLHTGYGVRYYHIGGAGTASFPELHIHRDQVLFPVSPMWPELWHSRSMPHDLYWISHLGFVREGLQIGVVAIGDKTVSEKRRQNSQVPESACLPLGHKWTVCGIAGTSETSGPFCWPGHAAAAQSAPRQHWSHSIPQEHWGDGQAWSYLLCQTARCACDKKNYK